MSPLRSLTERSLRRRLRHLSRGNLILREGSSREGFGDPRVPAAQVVELQVLDRRFYPAVALGGNVGAGEAYAEGWWSCADPAALVRLFLRNREALEGLEGGWARLAAPARRLAAALRRNTRSGSRRNISAHYDLSNEFFALILDETLTYSCGVFEHPQTTLREASLAKYERIARLADLQPGEHVLEIGTGWGGFALHAATRHGCRVTTTTISRQQHALASRRVAEAGLGGRITVLDTDYRDLSGQYDKVVSIEMIEAVGHEYLPGFFEACAARLAPHGRLALQAITIEDRRYDSARREVDFIKRHIFPGSTIPSVSALCHAARGTDLRLVAAQDIGRHYVETLRCWRANLRRNWQRLNALGFDDRLLRCWEFYFCYCEGGFAEGALSDVQLGFAKPAAVASAALSARRSEDAAA